MSKGLQPPKPKKRKLELRGGNGQAFLCVVHESIVAGPSQTGKTVAQCMKVHKICTDHPGVQCLVVRNVFKAMRDTVLRTYSTVAAGCNIKVFGGESPTLYVYPNGSRLIPTGMDNLGNVLSGEYAAVYVNQAEELRMEAWETLGSRCTGRGTTYPHPQIFGDANPAGGSHWILKRAKDKKLALFESYHRDNPELYDQQGKLTVKGKEQMANLESTLTGIRRERLLLGKWVTSEGCVYANFDKHVHVCVRDKAEMKLWYITLDDGFTNPAVVLLVGSDPDGRMHVFEEFYQTGQPRETVVKQARLWNGQSKEEVEKRKEVWSGYHPCEAAAVDNAAPELVAQLVACGINAKGVKGRLEDTIPLVRDALEPVKGDTSERWPEGRPRLTIDPGCVETINEFETYKYKPGTDAPVKEFDHAMDALRYLKILVTEGTGAITSAKDVSVGTPQFGMRHFTPRRFTPTRTL